MSKDVVQDIPLGKIDESPTNPRQDFGDLNPLANSIKELGRVSQAILVRPVGDRFEIVYGHRRFRASKIAGMKTIRAQVRDLTDSEAYKEQLIENLQREDISPLEEAEGFDRMRRVFNLKAEDIAEQVGVSRATVFNRMKLLHLKEAGRKALRAGPPAGIDEHVALEIARFDSERIQEQLLKKAIDERMSYRELVQYIRKTFRRDEEGKALPAKKKPSAKQVEAAEAAVRTAVQNRVLKRVLEAIERKPNFDGNDVRLMLLALLNTSLADSTLRAREYQSSENAQRAVSGKLSPADNRVFLFEVATRDWLGDSTAEYSGELRALAKAYGVNLREIEANVRFEAEKQSHTDAAEALFKK